MSSSKDQGQRKAEKYLWITQGHGMPLLKFMIRKVTNRHTKVGRARVSMSPDRVQPLVIHEYEVSDHCNVVTRIKRTWLFHFPTFP